MAMIKQLALLGLLLGLGACEINQPEAPRLEGQWQCRNGITIDFKDQEHYAVSTPAGDSAGVYKLTPGENNFHSIAWNPGAGDSAPPLPVRFRYFKSRKGEPAARLFFYTHVIDDAVVCERKP